MVEVRVVGDQRLMMGHRIDPDDLARADHLAKAVARNDQVTRLRERRRGDEGAGESRAKDELRDLPDPHNEPTLTPRSGIDGPVEAAAYPGGLSSAEAAKRLAKLGPPERESSRSVASIVAGNVFTLFNAILGTFFVVLLALGLFADA